VAVSDGSYLYRLDQFITARMMHHLHFQDFILGQLDFLNGTDLGKVATPRSSFEVPSLRWMRKVKCFSMYFIAVLRSPAIQEGVKPGFRVFWRTLARMLREPRQIPQRLGDHLFPKKKHHQRGPHYKPDAVVIAPG
jgi:hypothetical protein